MIEAAWPVAPHPDLAKVYLDLRQGESHADRLARARTLTKLAPRDPESRMTLASAAITACDYKTARETMLPLIQGDERPTARMCLIMAELEEAEHGDSGFTRDWLARATRAPRDATWIAAGVISDQWLPALPGTGKLDAFVWQKPHEHVSAGGDAEEAIFRPVSVAATEPPILIEKPRVAIAAPEQQGEPAPAANTPSQEMTSEGTHTETETEPGRPIAVASMTSSGPGAEEPAKPQGLSRFLR